MPVLSVSLKVAASLFASADEAALRAGVGAPHPLLLALGHSERLFPLLRLLLCCCAPKIVPPGASSGSLSNYRPRLPMLAIN